MGSIASASDGEAAEKASAPSLVAAGSVPATGRLFILSGPSGVGKTTIIGHIREHGFPLGYCVTVTTRPPRLNERDGVDYHFLSVREVDRLLGSGGLLEHAVVHGGDRYGIPIGGLRAALREGNDVLIPPEVNGAATVRSKLPNAISIFVVPSDIKELIRRLSKRRSETPEQLAIRLETGLREMERVSEYDYVIVNEDDKVHQAAQEIEAIITAERRRVKPRLVTV